MAHGPEYISGETSSPHKRINLLGKEMYIYREVSSTNVMAKLMAHLGAPDGTIVMTASQTAGKGRMKRQWFCPPSKGILMSMILRPDIKIHYVPQLTLLCAVAAADTIRKVTGCKAKIKWPNDIVIGGKKVCGILAECSFYQGGPEYVIIGLGMNVNLVMDHLPPDCQEIGTSLRLELGHNVSRFKLIEQFIITWEEYFYEFLKKGHPYLRKKWIENNVTLGRIICINREPDPICGMAVDISERGGLLVRMPDGSLEEFLAEDISLGGTHYNRS